MYKKTRKIVCVSFLLVGLMGCTSMNSKFSCPNKPGVNCRSLDQVNDMVDRGLVGMEETHRSKNLNKWSMQNINRQPPQSDVLRMGEQVVRVWIAPYQDVNNNYHNESIIYTVVRKNKWAVQKEIGE